MANRNILSAAAASHHFFLIFLHFFLIPLEPSCPHLWTGFNPGATSNESRDRRRPFPRIAWVSRDMPVERGLAHAPWQLFVDKRFRASCNYLQSSSSPDG